MLLGKKTHKKNTEQTVVKCFAQGPELLATTPLQKHLGQTDNNFDSHIIKIDISVFT